MGVDYMLVISVVMGIEDRLGEDRLAGKGRYCIWLTGSRLPRIGIGFTRVDVCPTPG